MAVRGGVQIGVVVYELDVTFWFPKLQKNNARPCRLRRLLVYLGSEARVVEARLARDLNSLPQFLSSSFSQQVEFLAGGGEI